MGPLPISFWRVSHRFRPRSSLNYDSPSTEATLLLFLLIYVLFRLSLRQEPTESSFRTHMLSFIRAEEFTRASTTNHPFISDHTLPSFTPPQLRRARRFRRLPVPTPSSAQRLFYFVVRSRRFLLFFHSFPPAIAKPRDPLSAVQPLNSCADSLPSRFLSHLSTQSASKVLPHR